MKSPKDFPPNPLWLSTDHPTTPILASSDLFTDIRWTSPFGKQLAAVVSLKLLRVDDFPHPVLDIQLLDRVVLPNDRAGLDAIRLSSSCDVVPGSVEAAWWRKGWIVCGGTPTSYLGNS